jgi:hypothetical protein
MHGHEVALWSAISAFFGSLLAEGIFDIINPAQVYQYLAALIVAGLTGGSIYAKQRWDEAKKEEAETAVVKTRPTTLQKTDTKRSKKS